MKTYEKYIESLKTFSDFVTISEWAIKFGEIYPDELKKATKQAFNQKNNTNGIRELAHRIRKNLRENKNWSGLIAVYDHSTPMKVKYVGNLGIKDMEVFMNRLYEPSDNNNDKKSLPFETLIDELESIDLEYLYGNNHNLPYRKALMYIEDLEKIDTYEFSSRIMLEMAHRNSDVIQIIAQIECIQEIMKKTLIKFKKQNKQEIDKSSITLEIVNYFDNNESLIPYGLILEHFMYLFDMSLSKILKELDFDFFDINDAIEKFFKDNDISDETIKYLFILSSIIQYLQLRLRDEFLIYPNKYYKGIDDISVKKVRTKELIKGRIPNSKWALKKLNDIVIKDALDNFRKLKPTDLKTVTDYFFAYDYDKKKQENDDNKYITRQIKFELTKYHGIKIIEKIKKDEKVKKIDKGTFSYEECLERYDEFKDYDAEFHYTEKTIRDQISFMQEFIDSTKYHKPTKNISYPHLTDKHYKYLIFN